MQTKETVSQLDPISKSQFSEIAKFYRTEGEVMEYLAEHPSVHSMYREMQKTWQEKAMDIFMGRKSIPLTYDPFFKKMFHPDVHPNRLSHLISSLLGQDVEVVEALSNDDCLLPQDSLLIMDILVRLSDGSLANVEVQRVPYYFPAERMSCYSSDLVMRQYSRVRGEQGKKFSYSNLKKVYTIVIYESTSESKNLRTPGREYIHYGKTIFNTGLKLELLQEYCIVALDEYRKNLYDKGRIESEQDAWIGLLATEDMREAEKLMLVYPWLIEIYQEMARLLRDPEEVFKMYSEALRILDSNTVQYMIEEKQERIEEQQRQLEEQRGQLEKKNQEIAELRRLLMSK